jgi:hypothetical protein
LLFFSRKLANTGNSVKDSSNFDSLEAQDRQIDNHDDQLAKHGRLPHFHGRPTNHVRPILIIVNGKMPQNILHNDHTTIDHDSKVDGAQAQQCAGDAGGKHA